MNDWFLPFTLILRRFEVFSDVWSENAALFERLMEIHSNQPILYMYYGFNPNQTGGGGGIHPPSTFHAIISQNFFPAHSAFATFFFRVLRNFWCYFRKNRAYRSEVTQRYVIERRLKIWEFFGFLYKTWKMAFCAKNQFWALKVCYLPWF